MSTAWRWRRCPRCGFTGPGGAYKPADLFRPGWKQRGTMRRRCPNCRHVAQTQEFPVITQRQPAEVLA